MYLENLLVFSTVFIYQVTGSALHGPCFTTEDCGTIDTYCRNGTCVCKENFTVWYDSCLQLASPNIQCTKRHDCHAVLGVRSICTKKFTCACKPFHHVHLGQCVKNRDLHDTCEHDHQCYCGAGCQDKIACIHNNCSCKPGHKPYRIRRCIHDPDIITVEMLPPKSSIIHFTANTTSITSLSVHLVPSIVTLMTVLPLLIP